MNLKCYSRSCPVTLQCLAQGHDYSNVVNKSRNHQVEKKQNLQRELGQSGPNCWRRDLLSEPPDVKFQPVSEINVHLFLTNANPPHTQEDYTVVAE